MINILDGDEWIDELGLDKSTQYPTPFEQWYKEGYDEGYRQGWDESIDHIQASLERLTKK